MAAVFLAEEQQPRRSVAIKVLNPDVAIHVGRERFLREVDLLSGLTHPHIIPILTAGEAGDLLYYSMPFEEGETLRQMIQKHGQLDIDFSLLVAQEVADALQYAHARDVLHRDVKPENILISDGHAVVADFGIARAISVAGDHEITTAGVALGTPTYMSPEQAVSEASLDGRADIYALGCVLYEMLAGEPPFHGHTPRAVMARHAVDVVPALRTLRPSVPPTVEAAVVKALAKSPADRFGRARDFGEVLETASSLAKVERQTSRTVPVSRPSLRRPSWRFGVLLGVVLALALAGWFWTTRSGSGWLPPGPPPGGVSVAVLPLTNLGGDEFDHLSAGLAHEITGRLVQVANLTVKAHTSVLALMRGGLTIGEVVDSLHVRYFVDGSVQPAAESIRVMAQLVEAQTGSVLWSDRYDGKVDQALTLQGEIAGRVAEALVSTVGGPLEQSPSSVVHSPGHEPYLRGTEVFARRTFPAFQEAFAAFRAALRLDPALAPAYAGLASVYGLSIQYRYRIAGDGYEAAGTALALADQAISLDSGLALAYSARGFVASIANAPIEAVRADFERARALAPSSPSAAAWSAHLLIREGRYGEALASSLRSVELDPAVPSRRISVALNAIQQRRYDLVVLHAQVADAFAPNLLRPRELAALGLLLRGDVSECAASDLGPHAALLATCRQALGWTTDARAIIDSLEALMESGVELNQAYTNALFAQDLAGYYGYSGDAGGARRWLRKAFELTPIGVDARILESGMFDAILDDAGFREDLVRSRAAVWNRVSSERRRASANLAPLLAAYSRDGMLKGVDPNPIEGELASGAEPTLRSAPRSSSRREAALSGWKKRDDGWHF
jgi:serine/threonine-protein kinase